MTSERENYEYSKELSMMSDSASVIRISKIEFNMQRGSLKNI
jgi:hypothetical protein